MNGWMDGWMDGWVGACMHACVYVCVYIRAYVCMHVRAYACMCIYLQLYLFTYLFRSIRPPVAQSACLSCYIFMCTYLSTYSYSCLIICWLEGQTVGRAVQAKINRSCQGYKTPCRHSGVQVSWSIISVRGKRCRQQF